MQFKAQTNSADPAVLMLVSKKKKEKKKRMSHISFYTPTNVSGESGHFQVSISVSEFIVLYFLFLTPRLQYTSLPDKVFRFLHGTIKAIRFLEVINGLYLITLFLSQCHNGSQINSF